MLEQAKPLVHHGYELSTEDEERLAVLFNKLDINNDGRIDVNDLTEALRQLKVPQVPGQAQRFFDKYDHDEDGHIYFTDFVKYVSEHEKELRLSFSMLDTNQDGVIDLTEIMAAFHKLGVRIEQSEAESLLKRIDLDKTLKINFEEWREFFLLHSATDLRDIVAFWRHSTVIDIGEDCLIPDDFTESELRTGMWWRHLVAGGAAGAVSRTCTAPLDRLKVFLQVHGTKSNRMSVVSVWSHMLKEGGWRSLWRGNGVNVIKIAPESALKFMAYEQIKSFIKGGANRELGMGERFLAGSLAGALSQTAIYPMEVLKTRLALRKTGQYSGVWDCACKVYRAEGLRSFYRGYVPNLCGIIPYAGIDLAVYETLKRLYMTHNKIPSDPSILLLLACGTASSTCGQLASYPLALVRTKLQAKVTRGPTDTMVGLFRSILMTEGPRGLYRGITPNFMKVAPAVSISYVVYENVRKLLGVEMT